MFSKILSVISHICLSGKYSLNRHSRLVGSATFKLAQGICRKFSGSSCGDWRPSLNSSSWCWSRHLRWDRSLSQEQSSTTRLDEELILPTHDSELHPRPVTSTNKQNLRKENWNHKLRLSHPPKLSALYPHYLFPPLSTSCYACLYRFLSLFHKDVSSFSMETLPVLGCVTRAWCTQGPRWQREGTNGTMPHHEFLLTFHSLKNQSYMGTLRVSSL